MPYYESEGKISLIPTSAKLSDKLAVGTYTVVKDRDTSVYYLEITKNMDDSEALFGLMEKAERIVKTFMSRKKSTGVLAQGHQGTGKTELVRCVSSILRKQNIPTIIVNASFRGPEFIQFMTEISDECLIVFDEFDKNFSHSDQNQLLTLLSGVSSGKKLYMLTANDKSDISKYFNNRPGRIFYSFKMQGLTPADITSYSQKHLKNKDHLEGLLNFAQSKVVFTVDMLESVIEEMNRYDEPIEAIKDIINVGDLADYACYVGILVNKDGVISCVKSVSLHSTPPQLNNRALNFRVMINEMPGPDGNMVALSEPREIMETHTIKHTELFALNKVTKTYMYKTRDGYIALLQTSLFGNNIGEDDWASRDITTDDQQAEIIDTMRNHPWFEDSKTVSSKLSVELSKALNKAMTTQPLPSII